MDIVLQNCHRAANLSVLAPAENAVPAPVALHPSPQGSLHKMAPLMRGDEAIQLLRMINIDKFYHEISFLCSLSSDAAA